MQAVHKPRVITFYSFLRTVFSWKLPHWSQTALTLSRIFYVERSVHLGMKLYNDQRNAQVSNLFIYLLLP
jgi:hypothetical protein